MSLLSSVLFWYVEILIFGIGAAVPTPILLRNLSFAIFAYPLQQRFLRGRTLLNMYDALNTLSRHATAV